MRLVLHSAATLKGVNVCGAVAAALATMVWREGHKSWPLPPHLHHHNTNHQCSQKQTHFAVPNAEFEAWYEEAETSFSSRRWHPIAIRRRLANMQ